MAWTENVGGWTPGVFGSESSAIPIESRRVPNASGISVVMQPFPLPAIVALPPGAQEVVVGVSVAVR